MRKSKQSEIIINGPHIVSWCQKVIADEFGISIDELLQRTPRKAICWPRQMAVWLARDLSKLSYPDLAKHFQFKDHGTAINACNAVQNAIETDRDLAGELEHYKTKILQAL